MYIVHLSVNFGIITAPAPDSVQPLRTASAGSWVKSLDLRSSASRRPILGLVHGFSMVFPWFFHGFSYGNLILENCK